jgi:multidrug efflux system membrane fusion protein
VLFRSRLKAEFANKDKRLWPGQFVRVFLRLAERQNAVVVPAQAVQNGVNGQFVFVIKDDLTVDMREVKTLPAPDQNLIIDKGVSPGEKVVVDGQIMLVPGSLVEIKAAPAQPPQPSQQANATAAAPPPADNATARAPEQAAGKRP